MAPARKPKSPQPMEDGLTLRQSVAMRLQGKFEGEVSWKFGHASFETDRGKVFCFITSEGHLALKLPQPRIAELLEAGMATPLCMGQRSMREWAVVPDPESSTTLKLLRAAQLYVESLPVVPRKPRPAKKSPAKKSPKTERPH